MIEFFIDVARECFNIGNFNSLMAIICEWVAPRGPPPWEDPQTGSSGHSQAGGVQAQQVGVGEADYSPRQPAVPCACLKGLEEVPLLRQT